MALVYNGSMVVFWIMSCTGDIEPPALRTPHVATLHEGPTSAVATAGPSVLGVWEEQWHWLSGDGSVSSITQSKTNPIAIAERQGARFVLSDALELFRADGLVDLEVANAIEGTPTSLCDDGAALWISTTEGLFHWSGSTVLEVTLGGASPDGAVACGGTLFGESVAWIALGDALHAVANNGRSWAVFETRFFDGPIDSVAVDQGGPWVVAEQRLYRRDDEGWTEIVLPEPAQQVLSGRGADGVWVVTASGGLLWTRNDALIQPDIGPGISTEPLGRWQTDGLGRLVVRDADGLHRLAMDRPMWMLGPEPGATLADVTAIQLVITAPETLDDLTVELVEANQSLPVDESFTVALDPANLPGGVHTLRATATYNTLEVMVEREYLLLSPGSVTWADHVQPIHEASCAICHTSSAETLLTNRDDWQANIDAIIANVDSEAMPLGGPPLSSAERGLIRAWRDGQFP